MKRFLLSLLILMTLAATAHAHIAVLDNPGYAWTGASSTMVVISDPITITTGANVLVLDVEAFGNSNWTGFAFNINGTPLVQAAGQLTTGTYKTSSAIYYFYDPPTGSLTLSGTFGSATAAILDYYTLSGVDTAIAVDGYSTNGGSNTTASLTVSNSAGAFAAVSQALKAGAETYSYAATHGTASTNPSATINNLSGGSGYVLGLTAGTNAITATVDLNNGTTHPMSVAVFTASIPASGSSHWIAGDGNWSGGSNWDSSLVPNGSGQTATFSQTGDLTETITIDDSPTVGTLALGSTADSSTEYVFTGGTLTLSTSASGVVCVSGGTQTIISSIIGTGKVIQNGSGTLILSGSNSYSGGTFVNAGMIVATSSDALPDDGSLTIGSGGTLVFDPSFSLSSFAAAPASVSSVSPVPEPSSFVMLFIFFCGLSLMLGRHIMRFRNAFLGCVLSLALSSWACACEEGTSLPGPPGTPEPVTMGLLGAAAPCLLACWLRNKRRSRLDAMDEANDE